MQRIIIGKNRISMKYLSSCFTDPMISICEYIKNSYDAEATNISIKLGREITINDNGNGFPVRKGKPDLLTAIKSVGGYRFGHATQRHLFGVGIIAFIAIGDYMRIRTRSIYKGRLTKTMYSEMRSDDLTASIPSAYRVDLPAHGTEIVIKKLYKSSVLDIDKMARFIAIDQPAIASDKNVTIIIKNHERSVVVTPLQFQGIKFVRNAYDKKYGTINVELYITDCIEFPPAIRRNGETYYLDIKHYMDFDRFPWSSSKLTGFVDYIDAEVSIWDGFLPGKKNDYFYRFMIGIEQDLSAILKEYHS